MRLSVIRLGVLLVPVGLLTAGAASAQQVPRSAAPAMQSPQLRSQISIMERILEGAVNEGIHNAVNQMPDLFQGPGMFITPPRARGFKIDGYGVFFDVEVPELPATTLAISVLVRNNEIALVNELNQLRALVLQAVPEANKRGELTRSIDRLQARASGAALTEPGTPPRSGAAPMPANVLTPAAPAREPDEIYTAEVHKALTDVMLEHGVPVPSEEWFTIAVSQSRGGWAEPDTMTLYLSIQGKDLAALRAGKITSEEAAKRIVSKSY